jgi:hypothetical protein
MGGMEYFSFTINNRHEENAMANKNTKTDSKRNRAAKESSFKKKIYTKPHIEECKINVHPVLFSPSGLSCS